MSKLLPVSLSITDSPESIFDKCHESFKETIATKDRPFLAEKEIVVPLYWVDGKAELFWHIASIEEKPNLDIKPCVNDIASVLCDGNCILANDSIYLPTRKEWREKCIYRAVRARWIRDIVDLYNNNDSRVTYWEKEHPKKIVRLYLRYQEDEIDYAVVFEQKSEKRVILISAFPIFFMSKKKDFDKDFADYCAKKNR